MKVKDAIKQEEEAKWQVFIAIKHYNIGVKFKARGLDPARHTFSSGLRDNLAYI